MPKNEILDNLAAFLKSLLDKLFSEIKILSAEII